jgi:hypothetical protein
VQIVCRAAQQGAPLLACLIGCDKLACLSHPSASALQAPRDAEQRDLGGLTVICSTVMNNACNDVNAVVRDGS